MPGPRSAYRVCDDDGCVVGDDEAHQRFHAQMATQIRMLTALTAQIEQLTGAPVAPPDPDPVEPEPDPVEPEPDPTLDPDPTVEPAPAPDPDPTVEPAPAPDPDPTVEPAPAPDPTDEETA